MLSSLESMSKTKFYRCNVTFMSDEYTTLQTIVFRNIPGKLFQEKYLFQIQKLFNMLHCIRKPSSSKCFYRKFLELTTNQGTLH